MNAPALPPTAPTTLVIVLGASAWPNSQGFQASQAFVHAAQGIRDYVLDPQGFGLPTANLFDLFDALASASDQLEMLGSFLEQRTQAMKAANQAVRDVLVYFAGHGGFVGPSADFYLLHRRANASSLRATGMAIDALAEVLQEKARQTRRYLFLDCCFAAAAFRSFQGGPDQTAITKTLDAFHVQATSSGFPGKGTVLLCSSDQKSPSLLLPDESCTMFSHALLDVLRNGDLHRPLQLSLRDIKELAEDRLAALPEKNAPRPGLHSPDQSEGDVADVPFFPNPRAREEQRRQAEEAERVRLAREERMRNIAEQTAPLLSQTFPPTTSPHATIPLQGSVPQSPIVSPRDAMVPGLAPPMQPKRQRSPAVIVILILLVLILLGGASLGVWYVQHSSTSQALNDVAWAGSQFMAVGDSGTILTSPDGRTWVAQHSGTSSTLAGVAWSGSQFVTVGDSGTILTSPNGRTWVGAGANTSSTLLGVAWAGSQFMTVGDSGTILTSPDGRTWTAQHSYTSSTLAGVTWSGSQFVAVGTGGTILTSPDGRTWSGESSSNWPDLNDVTWAGSQFVAVGNSRTILTSPGGLELNWTDQYSSTSQYLDGVAWSGSQFVAVGNSGTILISPNGRTWTAQHSSTSQSLAGDSLVGLAVCGCGEELWRYPHLTLIHL